MSDNGLRGFIKDMESQVLMDNIDPEHLSMIATNAMQMVATNKAADHDEKKKTEQSYFVAMVLLNQLQQQAAQLRQDIREMEDRLSLLKERQLEIAEFLDEIDDLIGSNGEYNRGTALDLIERITGKRPDTSMSDAEVQSWLALEQAQLRTEQTGIEQEIEDIQNEIKTSQQQLDDIEQQIADLETSIHDPEISLEALDEFSKKGIVSEPNEQASTAEMKLDALGI